MKKKIELQMIFVLLIVLAIAGAWIFLIVKKDSLYVMLGSHELRFTAEDLLGVGLRSELRCAGGVVGHVRKITPDIVNGKPHFTIIAGVNDGYATWKFADTCKVKPSMVPTALSPSPIQLELATGACCAQPCKANETSSVVIRLEADPAKDELSELKDRYKILADQIESALGKFTAPQKDGGKSRLEDLLDALPHAATAMRSLDKVSATLAGKSRGSEIASERTPLENILRSIESSTGNLEGSTASLKSTVGEGGRLDAALDGLLSTLQSLQKATDTIKDTVANLNNTSVRKVNGLLDETNATMAILHDKADRFGNTWIGRRIIPPKKNPQDQPQPKSGKKQP